MSNIVNSSISSINTITEGTSIKGDITANGDFRLDGTLEGNITLTGKLVVGEKGAVKGNIICQNANIIGVVTGNVSVKEFLTLFASSRVLGDIITDRLSIEPGARFSGSCRMLDELSEPAKS